MPESIPTFSICNLDKDKFQNEEIAVYSLRDFIENSFNLVFPHRHSFFQILYISDGAGTHIIDFRKFEIKVGDIFFLAPGQIHQWIFEPNTDGILINFGENYLSSLVLNRFLPNSFLFFSGNVEYSYLENINNRILQILSSISVEYSIDQEHKNQIIQALLIQLFLNIDREMVHPSEQTKEKNNLVIIRNFEKLIEQHFLKIRLPKEYADLLFITPNHLNAVCKLIRNKTSGEMIRNRVILEAKRLLVHSDKNISEISFSLNFDNNSYFSRFFKKVEGISPEEFKTQNIQSLYSVNSYRNPRIM